MAWYDSLSHKCAMYSFHIAMILAVEFRVSIVRIVRAADDDVVADFHEWK